MHTQHTRQGVRCHAWKICPIPIFTCFFLTPPGGMFWVRLPSNTSYLNSRDGGLFLPDPGPQEAGGAADPPEGGGIRPLPWGGGAFRNSLDLSSSQVGPYRLCLPSWRIQLHPRKKWAKNSKPFKQKQVNTGGHPKRVHVGKARERQRPPAVGGGVSAGAPVQPG